MTDLPDLNKLPDHSPRQKLLTLFEFMKNREQLTEFGQESAIQFFMTWIGYLYLDYFQFHLNEANEIGEKYEPLLLSLIQPIYAITVMGFARRIDSAEGYADELWEEACWEKTNIEAFHEMFGSIVGKIEGWGMEELDEYIGNKSYQHLERNKIPKNAPTHHWWWYARFGRKRNKYFKYID